MIDIMTPYINRERINIQNKIKDEQYPPKEIIEKLRAQLVLLDDDFRKAYNILSVDHMPSFIENFENYINHTTSMSDEDKELFLLKEKDHLLDIKFLLNNENIRRPETLK